MESGGNESPPSRTTILGSFLRGRPRNHSQSHIQVNPESINHRELSPSTHPPPSPGGNNLGSNNPRRRTMTPLANSANNNNNSGNSGLGLTSMLRRRRSAGNVAATSTLAAPPPIATAATAAAALSLGTYNPTQSHRHSAMPHATGPTSNGQAAPTGTSNGGGGAGHRIRLVPHLDSRRSLKFDAIARDLKEGDPALRIGRFTDRSGLGLAAVNALGSNKLAFKSKVVSRAHAEIWVEQGSRFLVRDTKSSSGTFLNHVRLSPANTESRPFEIKDGDVLQLGVDYQGGTEDIYKSVKIKIEIGREWQSTANAFNTNALKNLKTLALPTPNSKQPTATVKVISSSGKSQIPDCCICLFSVTIRQALFIAPCSHTFHYKCIRPLLESHHPAFSCPLCRTYADLEEDVEVEIEVEDDADAEEVEANLETPIAINRKDMDATPTGEGEISVHLYSPEGENIMELDNPAASRSNSGLAIRGEGMGGAETEVEGDGNGTSRARGGTRRGGRGAGSGSGSGAASPILDFGDDEPMLVDLSQNHEMGILDGGAEGIIDVDGTAVGGKRKR